MYFKNVTEWVRNDWTFQEITVNGCNCLQMAISCCKVLYMAKNGLVKAKNGLEMDGKGLKWLDINGNGFNILEIPGHVFYDAAALASELPGRCDFGIPFQNWHAPLCRHQLGAT